MEPKPVVLIGWVRSPDAAHLATSLATELLGTHPGPLHHHCPGCGSIEHGRPSFDAAVDVSIGHAQELTLVAVSTAGPVGVDLEATGSTDLAWVHAEALAKARGTGLGAAAPEPGGVAVDLDVPGHLAVLVVLADELPELRTRPAVPGEPASPARR